MPQTGSRSVFMGAGAVRKCSPGRGGTALAGKVSPDSALFVAGAARGRDARSRPARYVRMIHPYRREDVAMQAWCKRLALSFIVTLGFATARLPAQAPVLPT